jgi:RHS repeat-associated protein
MYDATLGHFLERDPGNTAGVAFGRANTIRPGGISPVGNPFLDTGHRRHDPSLGRFSGRNALGLAVGDTNLYIYAKDNPAMIADPVGQAPCAPFPLGCPPSAINCSHYTSFGYLLSCVGTIYPAAELAVCLAVPAGVFSNCMRACLQRCEVALRCWGCQIRFTRCHADCGASCLATPAAPAY